jgi:hypothetical protein
LAELQTGTSLLLSGPIKILPSFNKFLIIPLPSY